MDILEIILPALIALIGVGVAWVSVIVARKAKDDARRAQDDAKKAAIGSTLTYCVERYGTIMKYKYEAITQKNAFFAEQYFRELFDLFWSETYLWVNDMIPDYIMQHWVNARADGWKEDKAIFTEEKKQGKVISTKEFTYQGQWDYAITNTFNSDKSFKDFMDYVHKDFISSKKKEADLVREKEKIREAINVDAERK